MHSRRRRTDGERKGERASVRPIRELLCRLLQLRGGEGEGRGVGPGCCDGRRGGGGGDRRLNDRDTATPSGGREEREGGQKVREGGEGRGGSVCAKPPASFSDKLGARAAAEEEEEEKEGRRPFAGQEFAKKDFVLPPSFFASERWLPLLLLLRLLAFAAVVLSVLTGAACLWNWMCGGGGFAKRRRRNARSEANRPARISRGGKRRQTHQPPPPPPDERKNEGGRVVRSFVRSPELRRRRPKERSSRVWSGGEGLTVYVRKRERSVPPRSPLSL